MKWIVVEIELFKFCGRDEHDKAINRWIKELRFFLTTPDPRQICAVPKLRTEGIIKGQITDPIFPIEYPLTLSNGNVLDGYERLAYDADKDEPIIE